MARRAGAGPFDSMIARTARAAAFWKWVLVFTELLVVSYFATCLLLSHMAGRRMRLETDSIPVLGIATSIAIFFLLFGSPFLVSSQRGLAILGWIIGAAALLLAGQ